MNKVYIGIDVGGMSLKGGIVDRQGNILYSTRVVTNYNDVDKYFIKDLRLLIDKLIENKPENSEIMGIGLGVPGTINNETGAIDYANNLNMLNFPVLPKLRDYPYPIYLSNDANCACFGEVKFGAAKGVKNCVLLTLGTGVGGGVVIDGKLYEGNAGKGTELGHTVVVVNGRQCTCGRKGCLETYASASGLIKTTKGHMMANRSSSMWDDVDDDISKVGGRTAFNAAKHGDIEANSVVDEYVMYLSEGIMNMNNIFRPDVILIGGGVSNQEDYLIDKIKKYCAKYDYGYKMTPAPEIKVAKLKNDAGIIGAASLAMVD